jgi:hypothetical protein
VGLHVTAHKLHKFGNGNIKWGPVKKVIANTHLSVFNIKSLNYDRRLRQEHLNSSTSPCPFSDKGVIYVIYSVNNSRMLSFLLLFSVLMLAMY